MPNTRVPSRRPIAESRRNVMRNLSRGFAVVGLIGLGAGFMLGTPTEAAYVDQDFAQPMAEVSVQTRQVLTSIDIGTYAGYGRLPDQRWLAWGDRRFGGGSDSSSQLRVNDITEAPALAGNTFEKVYSGGQSSFAIDNQGFGYFWGTNTNSVFANGTPVTTRYDLPQRGFNTGSLAGKKLASMCVSNDGVMAIDTDGWLHAWGTNTSGRFGLGTSGSPSIPTRVNSLEAKTITSCVLTASHSLMTDSAGTLYASGLGTSGQLGQGATSTSYTPLALPSLGKVTQIAAGAGYSIALDADNRLWGWGSNTSGQLGQGANSEGPNPKPLLINGRGQLEGKRIGQIEAADTGSIVFALTSDGDLYSWGSDISGALGKGPVIAASAEPTPVERTTSSLAGVAVAQVSCGSSTCMALDINGYAHAWGYAGYYVFGNGNSVTTGLPQTAVY